MALNRSFLASSAVLGISLGYIYKSIPNIPVHIEHGIDMQGSTARLINPRNYPSQSESYRADIVGPNVAGSLEPLVKGFFDNPVFTPESLALRLLQVRFTKFMDGPVIWHIPDKFTVGTAILGTFQVVDCGPNFVDLAFGSSWFVGFHRFSVDASGLRLESMSCSPYQLQRWMVVFHRWYALTLFRFGVAAARRNAEVLAK